MARGIKLYEVADGGVRHLVAARSEGDAVQTVARTLHTSSKEMNARKLSNLLDSTIVRSDYPED